jgi:hypothetical protein
VIRERLAPLPPGCREALEMASVLGRDFEYPPLAAATRNLIQGVPVGWGAAARATGKSTAMDIHHWWRFRDGKICFYRGTEDTARTQEMLSAD